MSEKSSCECLSEELLGLDGSGPFGGGMATLEDDGCGEVGRHDDVVGYE